MKDACKRNPPKAVSSVLQHVTPNDLRRFLAKIDTTPNACWVWRGYKGGEGYGQLFFLGTTHYAHRIAYALMVGDIPEGYTVHHSCGARACCNPEHLELLSIADNTTEANQRRLPPPLDNSNLLPGVGESEEGEYPIDEDDIPF